MMARSLLCVGLLASLAVAEGSGAFGLGARPTALKPMRGAGRASGDLTQPMRLRGGGPEKGAVIVTGGAGYIGTHCTVALHEAGYEVIILDNFSNSCPKSLERVSEITGKKIEHCYDVDIRDKPALDKVFAAHKGKIACVIHCAGLKAVGESVREPIAYYENNFVGTVNLLKSMAQHNCKRIVFSSSATVYGNPHTVPITEDFPLSCTNPYGRTKLFIEEMLRDVAKADPDWKIINLRYFNPVGAHDSGKIGEDPAGIPNNLMPYVAKVAVGKLPRLTVFGGDYDTPDGTGVRDYLHVMDLAFGHVAAVNKIEEIDGETVYNLGTGHGLSVLDMVKAMNKATGKEIPYIVGPRRAGDIATCYADATKAKTELKWEAKLNVDNMCADTWTWQSGNPNGYRTDEEVAAEEKAKAAVAA
eukprot:CAMPEP_0206232588 /NCGR_PEP_ID=MMETSP0047_2-20121206/11497_1 /ASSEMBLY_ACC=CAM_ASM_000192 /TAXON_ID=195065 /ORGANISM="Chroomonas mesostigmatica_cf, Strain CCMP1168" /LENGTH=415 /DNA_ID=CAMNT_0053656337 /DNA_START=20 /DNA_END=1267 /DNA_ORIENTATION=+